MDPKEVSANVLRLTEVLLHLLHQEKQFCDCCHSLEAIEKSIDALVKDVTEILEVYKNSESSGSSSISDLVHSFRDVSKFVRQSSKEEALADRLVIGFGITLNGAFCLLSIYDHLTEDSLEANIAPETSSPASSSILSIKQEATIRLSLGVTFKLAFRALLKSLFAEGEKLLPISVNNGNNHNTESVNINVNNRSLSANLQLCSQIYQSFLEFALKPSSASNARLQSTFFKDCFATLIACRIFFITCPEMKSTLEAIHDKLNRFSEIDSNQQMILRDLLLLRHCRPIPKIASLINRFLMQTFKQINGIETLVEAVLDSDPHSENLTTITTRISSIASILILLPVPNKEDYLKNLTSQALSLLQIDESIIKAHNLKHSPTIFWTVSSHVLLQIHSVDNSIVDKSIFESIRNVLDGKEEESFKFIDSAIEVIYRILNFTVGFPIEAFYNLFRPLLFIRFSLEHSKISPIKSLLDQIILNLLKNIPESVFLLDETINLPLGFWLNRYETEMDPIELCQKIVVKEKVDTEESDNFESIQMFTNVLLTLLAGMPSNYVYDLFFLLLEQIIGDRKNILSLLLLSSLGETLLEKTTEDNDTEEMELLANVKRIRFISNTFERIVSKIFDMKKNQKDDNFVIPSAQDNETDDEFGLFCETLKICISILVVIVERLEQLPLKVSGRTSTKLSKQQQNIDETALESIENIQRELKICEESLKKFFLNRNVSKIFQPLERIQAEDVLERLGKIIDNFRDGEDNDPSKVNNSALNKALASLREPLMPVRAHGLVVVRQLIQSKDPSINEKFELILESIRDLLLDSESYLYLAAINALGALAINHTDCILELLLNELIGIDPGQRKSAVLAINDRHKIGEALMQLAKSIGDFAYHYSEQFIGKLLIGVRSEDPTIRISSLVCLGKFCRNFKYGLASNIVELVFMGERLLTSDPCLEVRRAAADFFRQLLEGLDNENVCLVQEHIKPIKDALLKASANSLDDVLQLHCELAYDELSRIAQQLINVDPRLAAGFREIK